MVRPPWVFEFFEDSDNGTNKVTLIGRNSGDVTLTLPAVTDTVATVGDITACDCTWIVYINK